ncbi:hypothetical protein FRC08_009598 [Ceratobasidium sp. 394]|nr:hypothetical protein FRC08_009598 [Ceratobasidium sp. 394]
MYSPRPSCTSGVYFIKLVDLLLAAHSQVTKRGIDFTILMLDAINYVPTRQSLDTPDLIHALATSPHLGLNPGGEGRIGHLFTHLVSHIALRYCYHEHSFTSGSYQKAVEYLTLRPSELMVKHKQCRADVARVEQVAHASTKARKHKNGGRAVATIVLSIFMTEWQEAKKEARAYVRRGLK